MGRIVGDCLPSNIYEFFQKSTMTGVASTIDEDGYPRGAPMSMFYALDEKTLVMGVQNRSQTFKNAAREGKIALTFVGGGDVAFTVRGRARVFKEEMASSRYIGVLAVAVEAVKSDVADDVEVTEGIKIRFRSEKWKEFISRVLEELRSYRLEEVQEVLA